MAKNMPCAAFLSHDSKKLTLKENTRDKWGIMNMDWVLAYSKKLLLTVPNAIFRKKILSVSNA